MPQFISLSLFKGLFQDQSQLLTEDGHKAFLAKLQSEEGQKIAANADISSHDFLLFIESVKNSQNILFQSWIENDIELKELLSSGKLKGAFGDARGRLKHHWVEEFKKYLSPFLTESLLKKSPDEISELVKCYSFVPLLDTDHRSVVEMQLYKPLESRLKVLTTIKEIEDEQELIDTVHPLCGNDVISCVNYLSKASYAIKLEYVDLVLSAIRSKACTIRFANWILKRMEEIELNKEHEYKISDLKKELKQGELKVYNQGRGRTPIQWKTIVFTVISLLLVASVFYLIYFKPFSNNDNEFTNESSFAKFSKEQQDEIDSLIREMNGFNFEVDTSLFDEDHFILNDYPNASMRSIDADIRRDAALKLLQSSYDCEESVEFSPQHGEESLKNKKGKIISTIQNDSQYDVVLYVCTSNEKGSVYTAMLKKGKSIQIKLNPKDILTTLAGNVYSNYILPNVIGEVEAPSLAFKRHFCDTDDNYLNSLNMRLEIKKSKKSKARFILKGSLESKYQIRDVDRIAKTF